MVDAKFMSQCLRDILYIMNHVSRSVIEKCDLPIK